MLDKSQEAGLGDTLPSRAGEAPGAAVSACHLIPGLQVNNLHALAGHRYFLCLRRCKGLTNRAIHPNAFAVIDRAGGSCIPPADWARMALAALDHSLAVCERMRFTRRPFRPARVRSKLRPLRHELSTDPI